MFVYDFIDVPEPLERLLAHLSDTAADGPRARLDGVRLGEARARDDAVVVPFTATLQTGRHIPVSGDIELTRVGAHHTHVTLAGSYPRETGAVSSGALLRRHVALAIRSLLSDLDHAARTGAPS